MSEQTTFLTHGIKIPAGVRGNAKVVCPNCTPHDRRPENRNAKDLSVNVEEGIWLCHNCNWTGTLKKGKPKKEWVKPQPRLQKVSDKVVSYFEGRRISNDTLLRFGITEATEWMPQKGKEMTVICFNYFRCDELVNIKFRSADKDFKMSKDAELVFYNLDSLKGEKTAVIVEGEIDCLTMHECGIYNSVSVPNGASKGNQKLEYLDNCWQDFEGLEKIILCVDDDEAGNSLREELARRLGKVRCYTVTYPEGCKDANEVLQKHGKEAVKSFVYGAKEWPIEGIIAMEDMYDEVCDYYLNGYPTGTKSRIPGFDDLLSIAEGQLTTVTGIPGSGKDEFVNFIMANLSRFEGWPWGVCNFEEPSSFHVTKLVEKMTGKSFAFRKDPGHRVSTSEFEYGVAMVDRFFHYVNIDEVDITLDGILGKLEEMVKRFGIRGAIINPWNYIEHKIPNGYTETQYISEALTKLSNFCRRSGVHVFLIAHPTKIQKDDKTGKYKVPTLYNINGSSHFFNKTHNGICVYRDFETNVVDIYVQKVKWSWDGKVGFCSFGFNTDTRQYNPI